MTIDLALTWRIIYIGQASDPQYDQILEEADMENLQAGQMKFVFEVSYWMMPCLLLFTKRIDLNSNL